MSQTILQIIRKIKYNPVERKNYELVYQSKNNQQHHRNKKSTSLEALNRVMTLYCAMIHLYVYDCTWCS